MFPYISCIQQPDIAYDGNTLFNFLMPVENLRSLAKEAVTKCDNYKKEWQIHNFRESLIS